MTKIERVNSLIANVPGDISYSPDFNANDVSDGYHTFGELYEHRCLLYISMCAFVNYINKDEIGYIYKTRRNKEGITWKGWFLLTLNTSFGQISYHIPDKYWNMCNFKEKEFNESYDGHTSQDVIDRLKILIKDINK
jgi:hypothetical protein